MTDSVAVFDPGFRVTDHITGVPLSGAIVRFYDAQTTTPKTVYADSDLSTALGTSVTCDSGGYPTSDGSTRAIVFVGIAPYKVTFETSGGVVFLTLDNVKGAVEIVDPGDLSVVFDRPVVTKSLNYTVISGDQSSVIAVNCSGGDVTLTLPSAVTVGAGWFVTIQHAGSANQAMVATVSSQTISSGHLSYGAQVAMTASGEEVTLVSDGGNWRVIGHTHAHPKGGAPILQIVDRLSAPPGSPAQGAYYILTSSPSGAWSTFAEHDVAQWTGAAWVKLMPVEGWLAWVADEDTIYQHTGSAWQSEVSTTSKAGTIRSADAAAMEAKTSGRAVTADVAHRAPSAAKFWAKVGVSGGTPSIAVSENVTSITDTATGRLTVTIATDFSGAEWVCLATVEQGAVLPIFPVIEAGTLAAGSVVLRCYDVNSNLRDPGSWHIVGYGDHA